MTLWYFALQALGLVAFAVALWKGGRVERQAAAVLIVNFLLTIAITLSRSIHTTKIITVVEGATALVFLWLALSRQRWWLLAATSGLMLCVFTWAVRLLLPGIGYETAASAAVGEWALVYLALMGGALERWLAGETAVSAGRRARQKAT